MQFFIAFLIVLLPLLSACGGQNKEDSGRIPPDHADEDHEGGESSAEGISRGGEYSGRSHAACEEKESEGRRRGLSITGSLPFVSAVNMGAYEIKGYCPYSGRYVEISVNGVPVDKKPVCKRRHFKLDLDLTSLLHTRPERAVFRLTQMGSNVLCKSVRVSFRCPENYVPVPGLKGYYESSFCAMKYEAKLRDKNAGRASSIPELKPVSNASYEDAKALCRANGPQYDLITNDQWQTIARHIEEEDSNWSTGRSSVSSDNMLNCGVHQGAPKAASSNDEDYCASAVYCKKGQWSYYKRTHVLPGGHIIWDLCGNVGEMMKDAFHGARGKYKFKNHVYLLDDSVFLTEIRLNFGNASAKKRFGPRRRYDQVIGKNVKRNHYLGLGYADLSKGKSLIIRGGQSRNAGIFSVNLDKDQDDYAFKLGFRCVYTP